MSTPETYVHRQLTNGVELAIEELPGRRTVAYEIRVLTGMTDEPADLLGLAYIAEQTLSKGTALRTGQQLLDAFDAIGAQHSSGVGRESFALRGLCLPEYLGQALELHAEMLRLPSFPDEACRVAVDLAQQELTALDDDPDELARRLLTRQVYGERLGRHPLGARETLDRIGRASIEAFWRQNFAAVRMQVTIAGPVDPQFAADSLERLFAGFGSPPDDGRVPVAIDFHSRCTHQFKALEQQQIHVCWPGVAMTSREYPAERVLLAVLSDGMSSRLFTEVREKLGLVYWVGAWHEHPRSGGMIFCGASTTPQRCDETFEVLLREIDRLERDLTETELRRAQVGITARSETHGDITRARAAELSSDLFYYGRPVPLSEKNRRIEAVTVADIESYLAMHPRERLSVVTLGPRTLDASPRLAHLERIIEQGEGVPANAGISSARVAAMVGEEGSVG